MTIGDRPICLVCEHLHDDPDNFVCDAFPEEIPMEIILNGEDHRQPIEGDNGIQFEVAEGQEKRLQAILDMLGWA